MSFIRYIADENHYKEVLSLVAKAKRTVWIGTADIKDLYVDDKPFHSLIASLLKKGVEVRLIHAKEPGTSWREDHEKHPILYDGMERVLCSRVYFKYKKRVSKQRGGNLMAKMSAQLPALVIIQSQLYCFYYSFSYLVQIEAIPSENFSAICHVHGITTLPVLSMYPSLPFSSLTLAKPSEKNPANFQLHGITTLPDMSI